MWLGQADRDRSSENSDVFHLPVTVIVSSSPSSPVLTGSAEPCFTAHSVGQTIHQTSATVCPGHGAQPRRGSQTVTVYSPGTVLPAIAAMVDEWLASMGWGTTAPTDSIRLMQVGRDVEAL